MGAVKSFLNLYFSDFPFRRTINRSQRQEGSKWKEVLVKWGIPCAVSALCVFLSMWMLHIATYNYVHVMLQWEEDYSVKGNASQQKSDLSMGIYPKNLSFGSLNDPLEEALGYENIPIKDLDIVAAFFPAIFMLLAVLMDELGTFTRVMICTQGLALGKGMLGWMTTVPDSSGWANCQVRLGAFGMTYMSEERSIWELMSSEAFGVPGPDGSNVHLRWCADMLWSGHTYFTCLYALGAYELVYIITRDFTERNRKLARGCIIALAVGEQVVEIYCVLLNRFHYSMDVFVAVLVTMLFFTNGSVGIFTKWWINKDTNRPNEVHSDGDVQVPPCCFPCCMLAGRQHIFSDRDVAEIVSKLGLSTEKAFDVCADMRIPKQVVIDELEKAAGYEEWIDG